MKDNVEKIAEIFKALSCVTRLKIVMGLIDKSECNVNTMSEKLSLLQPNVSQHLSILKSAGIIEGFRKGNQVCYRVINEFVIKLVKIIKE